MATQLDNMAIARGRLAALIIDIDFWQSQTPDRLPTDFAIFCEEVFRYFELKYDRVKSNPNDDDRGMLFRNLVEFLQAQWMIAREVLQQHHGPKSEYVQALDRAAQGIYNELQNNFGSSVPSAKLYVYTDELPALTRVGIDGYGFISAPLFFLSSTNLWELQSVPHEIAHYFLAAVPGLEDELKDSVERNLQKLGYPATTRVAQLWNSWSTEIIADVVGTLLAGADHAESIQMLLLAPETRMFISDGRHPLPVLRPFVHIHTLQALAATNDDSQLASRAGALEAQWRARNPDFESQLYHEQFSSDVELIRLSELHAVIGPLVNALCTESIQSLASKSLLEGLQGTSATPYLPTLGMADQPEGLENYWKHTAELVDVYEHPGWRVFTLGELQEASEWIDAFIKGALSAEVPVAVQALLAEMEAINRVFAPLTNKIARVALPEYRRALATLLKQHDQNLQEADIAAKLRAFAAHAELNRSDLLIEEDALRLVNAGLSLASLRHTSVDQLMAVLNKDRHECEVILDWAAGQEFDLISFRISSEELVARKEFFFFFVVAIGGALAIKAAVG